MKLIRNAILIAVAAVAVHGEAFALTPAAAGAHRAAESTSVTHRNVVKHHNLRYSTHRGQGNHVARRHHA